MRRGIPESLPWVGVGLAVAAAVTRVMALPTVQVLLARLGLGTEPPDPLAGVLARHRARDGDR